MPRAKAGDRTVGPYFNKERGYWYTVRHYTDDKGKSKRDIEPCGSEEEGRDLVAAIAKAALERQEITVAEAISRWLEYRLTDKGNQARTVDLYQQELGQLLQDTAQPLADLTQARAAKLYRELTQRPVQLRATRTGERRTRPRAAATHQNALRTAQRWGAWLVQQELVQVSPFAAVEPIGVKNAGKPKHREDESQRWYAAALDEMARNPNAAAIYLARRFGLRAGEVLTLRGRSVQMDGYFLYVEDEGKTGERPYEVPEALRSTMLALKQATSDNGYLFPSMRTPQGLNKLCRRVCRAAGVQEVSPQSLRASYEAAQIRRGRSAEEVAAEQGHSVAVQRGHYVDKADYAIGKEARVIPLRRGA